MKRLAGSAGLQAAGPEGYKKVHFERVDQSGLGNIHADSNQPIAQTAARRSLHNRALLEQQFRGLFEVSPEGTKVAITRPGHIEPWSWKADVADL